MSNDFDDLPPLEDCSEILQYSTGLKSSDEIIKTKAEPTEYLEVNESYRFNSVEKLLKPKHNETISKKTDNSAHTKSQTNENHTPADKPVSFCGFSKGFLSQKKSLNNKSTTTNLQQTSKKVTTVISNPEKDSKIFPEVQESLKNQFPMLQSKDWINDDLLSQIESNPELAQQLSNPQLVDILTMLQKDPQQAQTVIERNPELKKFILQFSGLMGQHFTTLAKSQSDDNKKVNVSHLKEQKTMNNSSEQGRVEQLLADPEILKLLQDNDVQQLILSMRSDPERGQRLLKTADASLRIKINKLIDCGLLGMG